MDVDLRGDDLAIRVRVITTGGMLVLQAEVVGQVRNEILSELAEKEEAAISIWVTLEGEIRWRRYGNLGDRNSGSKSTSDVFLRDAELGLEFKPTDYLTGRLVLKSEYLGTETTDGGSEADSSVVVDESR